MEEQQLYAFRHASESEQQWKKRKELLEKYRSECPQQTLASLTQVFSDVQSGERRHPPSLMLPKHVHSDDVQHSKGSEGIHEENVTAKLHEDRKRSAISKSDIGAPQRKRKSSEAVRSSSEEEGGMSFVVPAKKSSLANLSSAEYKNRFCDGSRKHKKKDPVTCTNSSKVSSKESDERLSNTAGRKSRTCKLKDVGSSSLEESSDEMNSLPKCVMDNFLNILQLIRKCLSDDLSTLDTLHIVAKKFALKLEYFTKLLPTYFYECSLSIDTVLISKAVGSTVKKARVASAKLVIDKLMRLSHEIGSLSTNYFSKSKNWNRVSEKKLIFELTSRSVGKSPKHVDSFQKNSDARKSRFNSGVYAAPVPLRLASLLQNYTNNDSYKNISGDRKQVSSKSMKQKLDTRTVGRSCDSGHKLPSLENNISSGSGCDPTLDKNQNVDSLIDHNNSSPVAHLNDLRQEIRSVDNNRTQNSLGEEIQQEVTFEDDKNCRDDKTCSFQRIISFNNGMYVAVGFDKTSNPLSNPNTFDIVIRGCQGNVDELVDVGSTTPEVTTGLNKRPYIAYEQGTSITNLSPSDRHGFQSIVGSSKYISSSDTVIHKPDHRSESGPSSLRGGACKTPPNGTGGMMPIDMHEVCTFSNNRTGDVLDTGSDLNQISKSSDLQPGEIKQNSVGGIKQVVTSEVVGVGLNDACKLNTNKSNVSLNNTCHFQSALESSSSSSSAKLSPRSGILNLNHHTEIKLNYENNKNNTLSGTRNDNLLSKTVKTPDILGCIRKEVTSKAEGVRHNSICELDISRNDISPSKGHTSQSKVSGCKSIKLSDTIVHKSDDHSDRPNSLMDETCKTSTDGTRDPRPLYSRSIDANSNNVLFSTGNNSNLLFKPSHNKPGNTKLTSVGGMENECTSEVNQARLNSAREIDTKGSNANIHNVQSNQSAAESGIEVSSNAAVGHKFNCHESSSSLNGETSNITNGMKNISPSNIHEISTTSSGTNEGNILLGKATDTIIFSKLNSCTPDKVKRNSAESIEQDITGIKHCSIEQESVEQDIASCDTATNQSIQNSSPDCGRRHSSFDNATVKVPVDKSENQSLGSIHDRNHNNNDDIVLLRTGDDTNKALKHVTHKPFVHKNGSLQKTDTQKVKTPSSCGSLLNLKNRDSHAHENNSNQQKDSGPNEKDEDYVEFIKEVKHDTNNGITSCIEAQKAKTIANESRVRISSTDKKDSACEITVSCAERKQDFPGNITQTKLSSRVANPKQSVHNQGTLNSSGNWQVSSGMCKDTDSPVPSSQQATFGNTTSRHILSGTCKNTSLFSNIRNENHLLDKNETSQDRSWSSSERSIDLLEITKQLSGIHSLAKSLGEDFVGMVLFLRALVYIHTHSLKILDDVSKKFKLHVDCSVTVHTNTQFVSSYCCTLRINGFLVSKGMGHNETDARASAAKFAVDNLIAFSGEARDLKPQISKKSLPDSEGLNTDSSCKVNKQILHQPDGTTSGDVSSGNVSLANDVSSGNHVSSGNDVSLANNVSSGNDMSSGNDVSSGSDVLIISETCKSASESIAGNYINIFNKRVKEIGKNSSEGRSSFLAIMDFSDISEFDVMSSFTESAKLNKVKFRLSFDNTEVRRNFYEKRIDIFIDGELVARERGWKFDKIRAVIFPRAVNILKKTAFTIKLKYEHFDGFIVCWKEDSERIFPLKEFRFVERGSKKSSINQIKKIIEDYVEQNVCHDLFFFRFRGNEKAQIKRFAKEHHLYSYGFGNPNECHHVIISKYHTAHDLLSYLLRDDGSSSKYEVLPPTDSTVVSKF